MTPAIRAMAQRVGDCFTFCFIANSTTMTTASYCHVNTSFHGAWLKCAGQSDAACQIKSRHRLKHYRLIKHTAYLMRIQA